MLFYMFLPPGYLEEIHLIETKLDAENECVTRLLALAHHKVGMIFQQKDDVAESIEHLEQGLNLTKKCDGDNQDASEAMIADTLGILYASRQEYDAAKKYFLKVMVFTKRLLVVST